MTLPAAPPPTPPLATAPPGTSLLLALAGPLAAGALLSLVSGAGEGLTAALALPGIFAATSLLTFPALYIGASLLGIAPDAPVMLTVVVSAHRASGLILLGLSPALAFLFATLQHPGTAFSLMAATSAGAALAAIRAVHRDLTQAGGPQAGLASALVTGWALTVLPIGFHLFIRAFHVTGGVS